ncbi:hypothetical protein ACTXT7_013621 [Hymenolepis weldensis]
MKKNFFGTHHNENGFKVLTGVEKLPSPMIYLKLGRYIEDCNLASLRLRGLAISDIRFTAHYSRRSH